MTFTTVIILGRRNCIKCTRWRHILDFPPRRDRKTGEIRTVHGRCHHCQRKYERTKDEQLKRQQRDSQKAWERRDRRKKGVPERGPRRTGRRKYTSVDRLPFARWLKGKIDLHGSARVAERTGIPDRTIYGIVRGYGYDGKATREFGKKAKLRTIDYVSFDLVDKAFMAFDEEHLIKDYYPISREASKPAPSTIRRQRKQQSVEKIGTNEDVPNVIGEYQRRRRSRHPRSG